MTRISGTRALKNAKSAPSRRTYFLKTSRSMVTRASYRSSS
jgi:hypothetical protein